MKIVFAKHEKTDKFFIWKVPDGLPKIKTGDLLVVNTSRGQQLATAVAPVIDSVYAEQIARQNGAYFPLKKVVSVFTAEQRSVVLDIQSRAYGQVKVDLYAEVYAKVKAEILAKINENEVPF